MANVEIIDANEGNPSPTKSFQYSPAKRRTQNGSSSTHKPSHPEDHDFNLGSPEMKMDDADDEDIADLESSIIQQSRTIDDFTRIIAEWRTERERTQIRGDGASSFRGVSSRVLGDNNGESASNQNQLRIRSSMASLTADAARSSADVDTISQYSYEASSVGDPDEARMSPTLSASQSPYGLMGNDDPSRHSVRVRCTCCCGRGTRRCKRARRATREWSQMESDLRLAAQIGQALLRRSDALQAELGHKQEEHGTRLDSMMKKLTSSIKEAAHLEKRLEQSELNLEACEASNRALVREIEEGRRDLTKARGSNVRNSGLELKLERAEKELEDLRQELAEERKQSEQQKSRLKRSERITEDLTGQLRIAKVEGSRKELTEEERMRRKDEVRKLVEARLGQNSAAQRQDSTEGEGGDWMESLVSENDALTQELRQMKELLESRNEEVAQLREDLSQKDDYVFSSANTSHDVSSPLRISDLHSSAPVPFADELVDIRHGHPSSTDRKVSSSRSASYTDGHQTPSLLSPQMANTMLPSGPGSTSTNMTSEADSQTDLAGSKFSSKTTVALQANPSSTSSAIKRETRTAQLNALVDMIQRLFSRLSTADVDTLAKRLQRQKLAGDVGHLARTTVNGILRDIDGLRDHFRRAMDNESKGREVDNVSLHSRTSGKSNDRSNSNAESDSLVARKEFFALIKLFKDLFMEMARLRNTINEISMQPQQASRILQEQLGVQMSEDKGVTAWFGKLLSTTGLPGTTGNSGSSSNTTQGTSPSAAAAGLSALNASNARPNNAQRSSASSVQRPGVAYASAAVLPSAVAVEVKGMHATEQAQLQGGMDNNGSIGSGSRGTSPQPEQTTFSDLPSHARPEATRRQPSLSRVQSRNLSGLFVGSMSGSTDFGSIGGMRSRMPSEQTNSSLQGSRLSRIVDDDEISIHQGTINRARTLRPRNLSDSSMHTTYLDDEPVRSTEEHKPRMSGLMATTAPTPAALSRVITPSTLSLRASSTDTGTKSALSTSPSATYSSGGGGLLGSLVPTKSVTKAFGSLLGATSPAAETANPTVTSNSATASRPPQLRPKSSKAQLSLAAATAGSKNE
ncbi:uncharacterized protein FA14DRAFT_26165 [Meira miltonrushii]|uniref:Uncharacterized protein n=1 Tax=Meira miltonrushii TaxID=1280837 RepID=A0A316VL82_9BASI|nr:uncharacterized protein FA14DRAFT_26165 [Meira miltonrushii]PWN38362.1 hypothetical protein FA14DRAFT_26165 [Meira miltonrushii]